jgi:hypothetical protein
MDRRCGQLLRLEEFRSARWGRRTAPTIFQTIEAGGDADLLRESFGSEAGEGRKKKGNG